MSDEPRPSKLDGKRWGWGLTALGLLMALIAVVGTEVSPYAIILFVVIVSASVFWIWMLIDCLTTHFAEGSDKVSWVIVITFAYHGRRALLPCREDLPAATAAKSGSFRALSNRSATQLAPLPPLE